MRYTTLVATALAFLNFVSSVPVEHYPFAKRAISIGGGAGFDVDDIGGGRSGNVGSNVRPDFSLGLGPGGGSSDPRHVSSRIGRGGGGFDIGGGRHGNVGSGGRPAFSPELDGLRDPYSRIRGGGRKA